jgi:F-type H+-transporting ATPase subunit beta
MAKGKVVQVIGTVIDIEFPPGELPGILNRVDIPMPGGNRVVVEVHSHVGNNWVRGVAMTPTDGLARGIEASDTGAPISVPVGRACLRFRGGPAGRHGLSRRARLGGGGGSQALHQPEF